MSARSAKFPSGMPVELTSFVGRRQDVTAVRQLCSTARLVTLTGIGGVGKTRLAFRVASELRRAFPDGVHPVQLAALADPALLPHTVIDALGIREQSARAPMTVLTEHLRSQRLLLVLDNCEHLVGAVADLADQVLRVAPEVRILTTSRQALRIAGEHVYPVAPLPAPGPDTAINAGTALQYPSVTLLAERSAAVLPGFAVTEANAGAVVRLCQRLEGIPLAIELAAVRLRVLTVDELVHRLDDRFALLREGNRNLLQRHQTLQALVDWSHDLCTPREQLLWARSSVFAGGFDLEAVEAVCTDEALPRDAVLDTINGLLEKSILLRDEQTGQARYRMLETLRAYGQARVAETGGLQELGRRHRDWCLELVERAGDEWVGPHQQELANRLQLEHANLRRELEFCMTEPGEAMAGLRMAAVPWLWGATAHLAEGRLWLDRALALDTEPSHERAWALATAAYIAVFLGDDDAIASLPEAAYELAARLDDPAATAYATHVLGMRQAVSDDPGSAIPLLTEALEGYAGSDVQAQYPDSLKIELAAAHLFRREVDEAAAVVDEVFEQCTANGDQWNLSYARWGRGYVALLRGRPAAAEDELREALTMKRALHDNMGLAFVLELFAWAAAAREEPGRAATLLGAADRLWSSVVGTRHLAVQRAEFEQLARANASDGEFEAAFARGTTLGMEEALALALRERFIPPSDEPAEDEPGLPSLTRRQQEVATMVADGLSNKEIAARLVISLRTAEGHVEGILTKLGFSSRAQIASWITKQSVDTR